MMPVIRLSEGNWEGLKSWAIPLEDSPDDVIGRVLDAVEKQRGFVDVKKIDDKAQQRSVPKPGKRIPKGLKVPQSAYLQPILETLYEMGGGGPADEVLARVEQKMKPLLGPVDHDTLPGTGEVRWRNTAQWARYQLVQNGLMKDDSTRGVWDLTEAGVRAIEQNHRPA